MRNIGTRILSLALALGTAASLLCGSASAAASGKCGKNLTWKIAKGTLTISGTGAMDNYKETSPWMPYMDQVHSIVVSKGVTTIGNYAFSSDFESENEEDEETPPEIITSSVSLPSTLTSIGNYAFSGVPLTEVTIPAKVTKLGEEAFSWTKLRSVTFPQNSKLTTIGDGAFLNTASLRSITLPAKVKKLGECWCSDKIKVYFTGNAPKFSPYAFDGLTSVTAYYPLQNSTWTKAKRTNYGSNKKVAWKLWNAAVPQLSSVKGGSKALTVQWKKAAGVTGYEVQYAASAKFKQAKTVKVKGAKTVTAKVSKLKAKTTYYVRVRSDTASGGKHYYSNWSAALHAATK